MPPFGKLTQGAELQTILVIRLKMFLQEWLHTIPLKGRQLNKLPNILGSIMQYALNQKSETSLIKD